MLHTVTMDSEYNFKEGDTFSSFNEFEKKGNYLRRKRLSKFGGEIAELLLLLKNVLRNVNSNQKLNTKNSSDTRPSFPQSKKTSVGRGEIQQGSHSIKAIGKPDV